jgi:hypothetical protein
MTTQLTHHVTGLIVDVIEDDPNDDHIVIRSKRIEARIPRSYIDDGRWVPVPCAS